MLQVFVFIFFLSSFSFANTCDRSAQQTERDCLVCNCFYEARGEPFAGQIAVDKAVISRTKLVGYPRSVCAVVYSPGQFSWVSDSNPNKAVPAGHSCYRAADETLSFHGIAPDSFRSARLAGPRGCQWKATIGEHKFYRCSSQLKSGGSARVQNSGGVQ